MKISLQTNIRIFEGTVMTVVKYGSEAWTLRKADEDLLDVFQRDSLRIVLGTWLTDRIPNSRRYEKCCSVLLSRAITKERLRWLGHVVRMKDDRLPKIVLFAQPSRAKRLPFRERLVTGRFEPLVPRVFRRGYVQSYSCLFLLIKGGHLCCYFQSFFFSQSTMLKKRLTKKFCSY